MGGNDFFTFYVWGVSSQASNVPPYFSTVVLSMQNNSSAAQQGYVTYNGYPLLTHAVVNPGATLTYSNHFENDGCTPFVASLLSYGMNGNGLDPLGLPYTDQASTFANNLGGVQNGIYTNPEPDHRNMDQGFGMFSFGFVVSHQAAVFHKPAKGSLDDPAFGQHGKAALVFETWHHLQAQGARFAMRGHPSCEGRTGIGLVGPEAAQPAKPLERPTEELAGATLFGEIGRSNANPQQQTQGVHQNMAFAPLGFLAGIITARPRMVGGTDRLAVEDGGRGLGSSPGLAPDKSSEDFVNECPQPLASPATETAIDGFPRPELLGQQSPGTARSHQIKQAVKNAPPLDRSSASAFGFGQQWFKNSPLGVGQISWIRFVSHPSCSQNPLDKTCPRRILKRALTLVAGWKPIWEVSDQASNRRAFGSWQCGRNARHQVQMSVLGILESR